MSLRLAANGLPRDDLAAARDRFLRLLAQPRSYSFQFGWEPIFVQLGPPLAKGRYLLLPAIVCDAAGQRRGFDALEMPQVPHLTVGALKLGRGRTSGDGSSLQWEISGEP